MLNVGSKVIIKNRCDMCNSLIFITDSMESLCGKVRVIDSMHTNGSITYCKLKGGRGCNWDIRWLIECDSTPFKEQLKSVKFW